MQEAAWSVIKELGGSNYRCKMILGKSKHYEINTTCNGHVVWIWSDRVPMSIDMIDTHRYTISIYIYILWFKYIYIHITVYRHIIIYTHTHKHGHRTYAYRNERISTHAKWMIRRSSVSLENKWIASWRQRCPEMKGVWDQWGYS